MLTRVPNRGVSRFRQWRGRLVVGFGFAAFSVVSVWGAEEGLVQVGGPFWNAAEER